MTPPPPDPTPPAAPARPPELALQLVEFCMVADRLAHRMSRVLDLGTITERSTLFHLWAHGPTKQIELAAAVHVTRSAMSLAVRRLSALGHVRVLDSADDGRVRIVHLDPLPERIISTAFASIGTLPPITTHPDAGLLLADFTRFARVAGTQLDRMTDLEIRFLRQQTERALGTTTSPSSSGD